MTTWARSLKQLPLVSRLNAAFKAREQERRARRGLEWYRGEAARLGVSCPAGEELRRAVAARLAASGRRVVARPKGDLHVFLAYPLNDWERILPRSLAPFGEVTEFELTAHGFRVGAPAGGWLGIRDEVDRRMLEAFRAAHARRPVDVVAGYLSGYSVGANVLRQMGAAGAVVLNFCYDDKLNFPGEMAGGRWRSPAAIAGEVDLNLTNAPDSVVKYAVHGGLAMFWPEAAHPGVHRPYDVPFEFDVVFPGTAFGWRAEFVRRLRGLGIDAHGFGRGWPGGALSDEDLVRLYSRSRIVLGAGGIGHSRRLMCLKGRDFEVPMAGGLYLTSDNPELSLCYDVGREILTYRDESDCARTIRALLGDPERAAAIRAAGRRRALASHAYEERWSEALRAVGVLAGAS